MPIGGATLVSVSNILKEIYRGQIVDQLNSEIIGLKRIEGSSAGVESTVGGKYVTFPLRIQRNQGIGYRNENEALPAAGNQGYISARVGLKYGYGRTRFTGQTIELAKTNVQSFANAMDKEMNGLKDDIRKDCARIFYGDGNGALMTANAAGSTTTIVSTAPGALRYVEIGQSVDVYVAGGTLNAPAAASITGVNTATGTVTFTPAVGAATASGGYIVRTGSFAKEPNGLKSIVSNTGQLFNVDPTTQPLWAAVVASNAGTPRALSELLMIKMVDDVRVNGGKVSLILTSLGCRRAYFNLLTQQRRYTEVRNFDGGYIGLAFNSGREIPLVEDVDCPNSTMYFLDESKFTVYRDADWDWLDDDGEVLKWVVGFDAFECVLKKYWEIGIDQRNANGVIVDITEA